MLAVIGLDEDPDPGALVPLLARVRTLGFRLLVIFRSGEGAVLDEVARDLLVPALDERAEELVRGTERFEREWVRLNGLLDSASMAPRPDTDAATRRRQLRALRSLADPREQLAALKQLLRELRADLDARSRSLPARLPGQRTGPGPAGGP